MTSSRPPLRTLLARLRFLATVKVPKSIAYHFFLFRLANIELEGLNLGCGASRIKGFCNIDANRRVACDVIARVDKLKLSSNSVGAIYNSHVFEHIPRAEAVRVLTEWYRVLRPGGKLYLCVPDQEVLFRVYLDNLPLYDTTEGRYLVDRACYLTYGGQANRHDFHFYGYSFTTLKSLLESVGYEDVRRFDRSTSDIEFPRDISVAQVDSFQWSLNVEARKPDSPWAKT
ncbi:MAG: methyltransferase domain-containing protein [Dehalococcoidia bacterium]|nr:methyltransferase domain-containing protein [Dehalococcoidia bacterium]